MLDGAVVDEEPIKHSDVLVEDPEEVEKHAKKLEYSTKSPKKLARLSEELMNPSSTAYRDSGVRKRRIFSSKY